MLVLDIEERHVHEIANGRVLGSKDGPLGLSLDEVDDGDGRQDHDARDREQDSQAKRNHLGPPLGQSLE